MCCKTLFNLTNSPPISCFLLLLNHLIPAVLASCFCLEYPDTFWLRFSPQIVPLPRTCFQISISPTHLRFSSKVPFSLKPTVIYLKLWLPPFPISYVWYSFSVWFFFSPKSFNTSSHTVSFTYLFLLCLLSASCSWNVSLMRSGILLFLYFCTLLTLKSSWQIVEDG